MSAFLSASARWKTVDEVIASGDSSIELDGMDDAFHIYALSLKGVYASINNADMLCRFIQAGSPVTSSIYHYHTADLSVSSAAYNAVVSSGASSIDLFEALSNGHGAEGLFWIVKPSDTSWYQSIFGVGTHHTPSGIISFGSIGNGNANTGLHIFPGSGTITGQFRLHGVT